MRQKDKFLLLLALAGLPIGKTAAEESGSTVMFRFNRKSGKVRSEFPER